MLMQLLVFRIHPGMRADEVVRSRLVQFSHWERRTLDGTPTIEWFYRYVS